VDGRCWVIRTIGGVALEGAGLSGGACDGRGLEEGGALDLFVRLPRIGPVEGR